MVFEGGGDAAKEDVGQRDDLGLYHGQVANELTDAFL